ncbi:uncharacterized protein LOC126836369 [Adelges cooleyi]|uniref:uncharacterized protein LOC126836369 n=1 Tax=Adelges cooleyi TaxID=133065 RepID=UPI00217F59F7|nr:uncharacterized protein LOC126836369 [Adelges cooleyi]
MDIIPRIQALPDMNPMETAIYSLQLMLQELEKIMGQSINDFDMDMQTLNDAAADRRDHLVIALKNVIRRRLLDAPVQHVDDEAEVLLKCHFIGLYLSVQSPKSYIIEVKIYSIDFTILCILTDKHNAQRRYRKIANAWSEIIPDNHNQSLKSLEEQLRLGIPQDPPRS